MLKPLINSTILWAITLIIPMVSFTHGDGNIYYGGGYQVSISTNGSYYGCNPKKQCLSVKKYSYRSRGQYIWERKGITYSMTPLYNQQKNYQLKVIDQNRKILVNQIMRCDC